MHSELCWNSIKIWENITDNVKNEYKKKYYNNNFMKVLQVIFSFGSRPRHFRFAQAHFPFRVILVGRVGCFLKVFLTSSFKCSRFCKKSIFDGKIYIYFQVTSTLWVCFLICFRFYVSPKIASLLNYVSCHLTWSSM